jgi:hypothetical protein
MSLNLPNPDGGDTPLTSSDSSSKKPKKQSREERNLARNKAREEKKLAASTKKTTTKTKRSEPKTRGSATNALPQNRREIPLSSFDLLNGAFKKSTRNKKSMTILGTFFAVASVGIAGLGYLDMQEANGLRSEIAALVDEKEKAMTDFGVLTGLAVSETELFQRNDLLVLSAIRSTVTQPDIVGLFNDLNFISNPLVQVNSVTISAPVFVPVESTSNSTNQTSNDASKPKQEILQPAQVVITVSGASLNDIIAWAEALRNSDILENFQFARRGDSVTVTASFIKGHISGNDLATLSRFGLGPENIREVTEGPQEVVAISEDLINPEGGEATDSTENDAQNRQGGGN